MVNLMSKQILEYPALERMALSILACHGTLGNVLIYEDTKVNVALSSLWGNVSTDTCLTVVKQGYKFDGILGLYRAASSVEHKPQDTLVNNFCGSVLRTDLEGREGTWGEGIISGL